MKLEIVTTQKTTEYDVDWVDITTPVGNFVLQKSHAPMMIELSPDKDILFQLSNGKEGSLFISQGIAHITRESVKILLPIDV